MSKDAKLDQLCKELVFWYCHGFDHPMVKHTIKKLVKLWGSK